LAAAADRRFPGFGKAILFCLMFFGIELSLELPFIAVGAIVFHGARPPESAMIWFTAIANTIAFAVLLLIGRAWARRPWGEILPFTRVWHPALLALVPFAFGTGVLLSEVDNATTALLPPPEFLLRMMRELSSSGAASAFTLVVVAPFTEEAFFRGFAMNGFLKRYTPRRAIVASALLFAVFHLNPYQMIGAFALGLVAGWLRFATGSLWPCVALHALNNGLGFAAMHLPFIIPGVNAFDTGDFQPLWLDALGAVLFAAGGIPLYRFVLSRRPI
jgi:membrane protease YdiL (CAAX protease family)